MLKSAILFPLAFLAATSAQNQSQQPAQPESTAPAQTAPAAKEKKPQVKYNFLNVCTPAEAEQKEIKAALNRIPGTPKYNDDFEISRGRTSLKDAEPARYLRLRRDLTGSSDFNTVQYSLSTDANDNHETLVLNFKDPKDLFMISLEDKVSSKATAPPSLLDADTPASHIKLERFGKSSLVLARCEATDQSAYEPLFKQASQIFAAYRKSLGLRGMFRNELKWMVTTSGDSKPAAKASNPTKDSSAKKK